MKTLRTVIAYLVMGIWVSVLLCPMAIASETGDDAVSEVTQQLEAIDSLQEMQDKRAEYTASGHYDINTTSETVIAAHNAARSGYDSYVDTMFAARIAAQTAYDALTPAQQAQIDPALVAKLNNSLSTVFRSGTFPVTPGDNEYIFEAVDGGFGYAYEVSNHMVSGNIPQTFILVDTSDGKTSWTPNGLYQYGVSNYDVAYCCDVQTGLAYGSNYKRLNLEDSGYYSPSAAGHIRAIVMYAYPFVTAAQMRANLKASGLNGAFVDTLTEADMIAATQQAIWTYANSADAWSNVGYYASIDVTRNIGRYFTPLHDYTNRCWDWFPGRGVRSYDPAAAYRVNNLAYHLCNLGSVAASEDAIVISKVDITRASLVEGSGDTYELGMYVYLNAGAGAGDRLTITVTSTGADGSVTGKSAITVYEANTYAMSVSARYGDTITVTVEGTQNLGKGVYFYEPEGGRSASQCLVGVGDGNTRVRATETFTFNTDIETGLRIYKTETDSDLPISDITFDVYSVVLAEGEAVGDVPTEEEIARFATEANKVGSVTTDATGYASLTLGEGIYLVVEQHNADKVKAPVDPFYIILPMPVAGSSTEGETEGETDTGTSVEYLPIVSVYPKNEPVTPPDNPPYIPPPPANVSGSFSIIKYDTYDESKRLSGAVFQVYRAAGTGDTNTKIVSCNGIEYAVVPVTVNGSDLVLTTDENGAASSPQLTCGTYFLVETEAPKGYNLPEEAVSVAAVSSLASAQEVLYIANTPGNILPSTGSTGTKWLIVTGSILIVVSGVILVTRKKMRNFDYKSEWIPGEHIDI